MEKEGSTWVVIQTLCVVAAFAFGGWLGLPIVRSIASDVIAACAILAAFLIQIMLLLATIVTPGKMAPITFQEISRELDHGQRAARRLFAIYVSTIAIFIAGKMSGEWKPGAGEVFESLASIIVGACSIGILTYAMLRTLSFLKVLEGLQQLRNRLILEELRFNSRPAPVERPAVLDEHPAEQRGRPMVIGDHPGSASDPSRPTGGA